LSQSNVICGHIDLGTPVAMLSSPRFGASGIPLRSREEQSLDTHCTSRNGIELSIPIARRVARTLDREIEESDDSESESTGSENEGPLNLIVHS
jgi:hypothetical protein